MIIALAIGRAGSSSFRNKNIKKTSAGKYFFQYGLEAAYKSKYIDKIYVNTDIPIVKKFKKKYNLHFIERKKNLATKKALGDTVFHETIKKIEKIEKKKITAYVLLFFNVITVKTSLIDRAILKLKRNPKADSVITVSSYNMFSPVRARKLNKKGFLVPFVPFEKMFNSKKINCDRDSLGDVYFADQSCTVARPRVFKNFKDNLLPMKWMGKKILPLVSEYGLDIDFEWQVPQAEFWLKNH